jgi:hypothetical protein
MVQLVSPWQDGITVHTYAMNKTSFPLLDSCACNAYGLMHGLPRQMPCYNDGQE